MTSLELAARGICNRRVKQEYFLLLYPVVFATSTIVASLFCVIYSALQIFFKGRSGSYRAKLNTVTEIDYEVPADQNLTCEMVQ